MFASFRKNKNAEGLNPTLENPIKSRGLWQNAFSRFCRNKAAMTSTLMLLCIILVCVFAPYGLPYAYDQTDFAHANEGISAAHWFGTDSSGRDLLVRTLVGGRVSLMVGLVASLVSVFIGILVGSVAGYVGGRVDVFMMRVVDIIYALPVMFLIILLMVMFGRNIFLIFIAIGAVSWLTMARIVRGQTISLKHREFIDSARSIGASPVRIVGRHIIPNLLGTVAVYTTLTVPTNILFESTLSFLGLGVSEPLTSWGVLISEGAPVMEVYPNYLLFPSLFLIVTLFCLNFIGDGLRDALDPKDR